MVIKVKQAAEILKVSPSTVRNWCSTGKLPYELSAAGQRVFKETDLLAFFPIAEEKEEIWFYTRSSNGNDILVETQIEKLVLAYGEPQKIFRDNASGLNENRKSLNMMLKTLKENDKKVRIYVTNKDRLVRFGYRHLCELIEELGGTVETLDANEIKEPQETLMEDFMSLIASFSGKFYRIRGWEQQKRLLKDAEIKLDERSK